ncbi:MAG: 2-polyprenylphenol 6-hydroxylase [Hyphomicrobiaceae bacterium]
MASAVSSIYRLARAGFVLAQYGVRFVPKGHDVPLVLHVARALTWPVRMVTFPFRIGQKRERRIGAAIAKLGPSYIKLGQFMATRADVIGLDLARDLGHLQDKLDPFPMAEARRAVEDALGGKIGDHFTSFGPAIAAASIAQVHKATVATEDGEKTVAVKILRPGIERRFKRDLDSYFFAARLVERFHPPSRRLRPIAVVDTLRRTTELEMDLRLEAAAISEMADNIKADTHADSGNFRVPEVDWLRTAKRVMTLEWIEGTPISDTEALVARGHDLEALGLIVIRSFLRHAMRDGFFHADMHQGNLFVDADGAVVAVDFGIMGRLERIERRFLAEILNGLITRDYTQAAQVHFDAGYVPAHHPVAVFAQAMRAIGEPIHGRTADQISMADLLGQLFAYTEVFDMETRPELIMLQKSMVIVEGVARSLDPTLNMWVAAEPIAREWVEAQYGVSGRLRDAGEGAGAIGRLIGEVPRLIAQTERAGQSLASMAENGVRLDDETIRRIAKEERRQGNWSRAALWVIAAAIVVLAYTALMEK